MCKCCTNNVIAQKFKTKCTAHSTQRIREEKKLEKIKNSLNTEQTQRDIKHVVLRSRSEWPTFVFFFIYCGYRMYWADRKIVTTHKATQSIAFEYLSKLRTDGRHLWIVFRELKVRMICKSLAVECVRRIEIKFAKIVKSLLIILPLHKLSFISSLTFTFH